MFDSLSKMIKLSTFNILPSVKMEHPPKNQAQEMEHLSSEMEQQNQVQWRRDKVQELYSKGYREIFQTLQIVLLLLLLCSK